mmetsp:Transcript_49735/g.50569  ORF Transcript_49735/g.50569 Transcript_49735/m.50569 type:complete len:98 (+) Transcript_49735:420-713(+)
MVCLYDIYHECMAKREEKTKKFKAAPFIADPTNSKGKGTKLLPKVCSAIANAFETHSKVKVTPRQYEEVLNDIHNQIHGKTIDESDDDDNDDNDDED